MKGRAGPRGFTLLELVVVLVLIGLLLAFSPMALDTVVAERELENEVSRYGTMIELLARESVLSRTPHAIHIDTDNHRWAVQIPEEMTQSGGAVTEQPVTALVLRDIDDYEGELDWHEPPDGITFEYYEGTRRIQSGRYRIVVNPTGTIDPHSLVFESNRVSSLDERDRMRTVKVNFPGFVSFAPGRHLEEVRLSEAELGR